MAYGQPMKSEAIKRLDQEFTKKRMKNAGFSLRAFSRWLGSSPAQVSQILSGKRNLTVKQADLFADRMGFSPKEKLKFLSHLNPEISKALRTLRDEIPFHQLEEEKFRLIADWYHFAILSLMETAGAKSDPRWIARRLGLEVRLVNECLQRLEKLKIIGLKPSIRQITPPLRVLSNLPSQAIRAHHRQNLDLASSRLDTVPPDQREFHSITFAANPANLSQLKRKIDRFLSEISSHMAEGEKTEVYTLSLQLFPLTKFGEKK